MLCLAQGRKLLMWEKCWLLIEKSMCCLSPEVLKLERCNYILKHNSIPTLHLSLLVFFYAI